MKNALKVFRVLLISLGMVILTVDTKTAVDGASEGIALCLQVIIPSLFPFILLSLLLASQLVLGRSPLIRGIGHVLKIPEGLEGLLLTGILGGYPAGAQGVQQAFASGGLSTKNAARLLGLCNNCGPAFIFGIGMRCFPDARVPWAVWGIHVISTLCVAILHPGDRHANATIRTSPVSWSEGVRICTRTMAGICGWVLLFRILLSFLEKYLLTNVPLTVKVALSGLLEISNGSIMLLSVTNSGLRFLLFEGIVSFGGLCVWMQTFSVVDSQVPRYPYILWKVLQTTVSVSIAYFLQFLLFPYQNTIRINGYAIGIVATLFAFTVFYLRNKEKNSRNLVATDV